MSVIALEAVSETEVDVPPSIVQKLRKSQNTSLRRMVSKLAPHESDQDRLAGKALKFVSFGVSCCEKFD